jgi:Tol biopolymer transport system component
MFGTGSSQIAAVDVATGERSVLTSGDGIKVFPAAAAARIAYVTRTGLRFTDGERETAGDFARPSWSASGRAMVFHRDTRPADSFYGQPRPSPDNRFALSLYSDAVSVAPDGKRVALIGTNFVGPVRNGRISVASRDGGAVATVFDGPTNETMAGIAWSPRGDEILFGLGGYFGAAERLPARIMSVRPDGSGSKAISNGSTNDGMPSWSPDGSEIVFRVANAGTRGLYILDLATNERRKLATGSDYDTFPAWSPTGEWITFTSFRDGDYEIYRIRPDGSGLQRLTYIPGNDAHSAFSPDGEWIAFTTAKQGFKDESLALTIGTLPPPFQANGEIAVMRADGSDLRLLTDNSVEDGWPVWIPRTN